jgi:hypothetical protein
MRNSLLAHGWLVLVAVASAAPAEELDCSLHVRGNIVVVEVLNERSLPAKGVPVRLVNGKGEVLAQGKINADGEWSWPLFASGSYQVVVEQGPAEKEWLRLPVEYRDPALQAPSPDDAKCPHCPTPPPLPEESVATESTVPWIPVTAAGGLVGVVSVALCFAWWRRGRPEDPLGESHE